MPAEGGHGGVSFCQHRRQRGHKGLKVFAGHFFQARLTFAKLFMVWEALDMASPFSRTFN